MYVRTYVSHMGRGSGPWALAHAGANGPIWVPCGPICMSHRHSTAKSLDLLAQTDKSAEQHISGHNDTRPKEFSPRRTFMLYHFMPRAHMLTFMSSRLFLRFGDICGRGF